MNPQAVLAAEPIVRLTVFLSVLGIVALWEAAAPRRTRAFARGRRWPHNLALVALDTGLVRLLVPGAGIAVAIAAQARGWGLLNTAGIPAWAATPLAVLLLDLVIYLQHVMFHALPALWRLHRVHHSDPDFDLTTGGRFHPVEILLSALVKMAAIAALGAPALAVLVFEVLLNATSTFNHANARLPLALDARLRLLLVTPDMHRVHHSILREETDSNFGFALPWWDRLFGTYRAQPAAGHQAMTIGVDGLPGAQALRLDRLLVQPFRARPRAGAADRRPTGVQEEASLRSRRWKS